MLPFPFRAVVFDLDGTLADTSPDIVAALNHALGAMGRAASPHDKVRRLVGGGARSLIAKALAATGDTSENLIDAAQHAYLDRYAAHVCDGTRPYPGVEDALTELGHADVALAICTNKPARLTHPLLEALGWSGRFAAVISEDTLSVRKPDPRPLAEAIARAGGGSAAYVGDSITDVRTARAAGVPVVLFSGGFSDRPVAELGADRVIGGWGALIPALRSLSEADASPA